jgi:two-component system LytT family response regulator
MNCIIVEDDSLSAFALTKLLKNYESIVIEGEFETAESALQFLKDNPIDLIFLDVELPGINGFELLQSLEYKPFVICISSKKEYAFDAFKYDVIDYLSKPIDAERLQKALDKVQSLQKNQLEESGYFFMKVDSKLVKIYLDKIKYIEALGDYVRIITETGKFTVLHTMKGMVEKLPEESFIRIHKSYIVNLKKLKSVSHTTVSIDELELPVSRTHKDELFERFKLS